ncbi:PREDICTED: protein diaphanous homolog 3-like [Nanorana parkeri]|uniref:protein diaphanous homolog 3-like n=1 Tax=Nanorana parkeri TaxID=125878 RepID=UPI000854E2C0|nr:PREDICTED: protein diaphanous homolog 3-like [Nanorana parkeri]
MDRGKMSRKQRGGPAYPTYPEPTGHPGEDGDKKFSKFQINKLRNLTDDVLDRFSSIRIPGSRKDRPNLNNIKNYNTSADWSTSSEHDDFPPKQLSDKEVLALFEKMMEDMNLNEDRKAPLREKDIATKKEMVTQYISTASQAGSLKSSRQISPQEFIHELKTGSTDERLVSYLDSLRVSLTSNPVRCLLICGIDEEKSG